PSTSGIFTISPPKWRLGPGTLFVWHVICLRFGATNDGWVSRSTRVILLSLPRLGNLLSSENVHLRFLGRRPLAVNLLLGSTQIACRVRKPPKGATAYSPGSERRRSGDPG